MTILQWYLDKNNYLYDGLVIGVLSETTKKLHTDLIEVWFEESLPRLVYIAVKCSATSDVNLIDACDLLSQNDSLLFSLLQINFTFVELW